MNAGYSLLAALFIAVALPACGGGRDETAAPMPLEDTVFADTVGAKDKARAVEDTMNQRKDELDRAMENAQEQ